eukprot:2218480-Amphidinium_carterae.1
MFLYMYIDIEELAGLGIQKWFIVTPDKSNNINLVEVNYVNFCLLLSLLRCHGKSEREVQLLLLEEAGVPAPQKHFASRQDPTEEQHPEVEPQDRLPVAFAKGVPES